MAGRAAFTVAGMAAADGSVVGSASWGSIAVNLQAEFAAASPWQRLTATRVLEPMAPCGISP
jgi:hypothetical protein